MSGAVIAVIVAVVVVIAIVAAVAMMRGNGTSGAGLKRRFGPEYERTLAQHNGDDKAAREELAERVKRYGDIERQPVSAQQREQYGARWAEIQAHFVDDPGRALNEADRLIAEVAAERGYPASNSPEHFDALSVHHPHEIQGYRQAHELADHSGTGVNAGTGTGTETGADGRKVTEDMRQALVSSRALFDDMLRDTGTSDRTTAPVETTSTDLDGNAPAGTAPAPGTEPVAATGEPVSGATTDPATDSTAEPIGTPAAERDRDDADARSAADPAADPEAAAGTGTRDAGEEHHRPLADRFAGLTGAGRRSRDTDDHSS